MTCRDETISIMWHQIRLRKDPWPSGELTFINNRLSKTSCINVNQKLLYENYGYGKRAETNVKCKNLQSVTDSLLPCY